MVEWWSGLEPVMKFLYCVAIPASLIFVIQTILSMAGGFDSGAGVDISDTSGLDFDSGADMGDLADASDLDTDVSNDGGNPSDFSVLRMFTLQGIVAFLAVFGWSSIVSIHVGTSPSLSVFVGLILGFLAMLALAKIVQMSKKLTENGTLDMKNAIGESGRVYIPIPPTGRGEGKVTLQIQGSFMECSALSFSETVLETGTYVRITDVRDGILVVEAEK